MKLINLLILEMFYTAYGFVANDLSEYRTVSNNFDEDSYKFLDKKVTMNY
jgi:hypothetical protein